jgi:hypothetical protein
MARDPVLVSSTKGRGKQARDVPKDNTQRPKQARAERKESETMKANNPSDKATGSRNEERSKATHVPHLRCRPVFGSINPYKPAMRQNSQGTSQRTKQGLAKQPRTRRNKPATSEPRNQGTGQRNQRRAKESRDLPNNPRTGQNSPWPEPSKAREEPKHKPRTRQNKSRTRKQPHKRRQWHIDKGQRMIQTRAKKNRPLSGSVPKIAGLTGSFVHTNKVQKL